LVTVACGNPDKNNTSKRNFPPEVSQFDFGDYVRVRAAPATEAAGAAGRIGYVAGFTKPSHTGIEVIGEVKNDLAFGVTFENPHTQLWFAPELLEFVDYGAGQDMQIGNKRWVRRSDGSWEEVKDH
jgi:hypothetical protein